jgi:hypothetical protein
VERYSCASNAKPHGVTLQLQGFSQLNSLGLSFDLQANPSQLLPFAAAYAQLPGAPVVIIDHMYARFCVICSSLTRQIPLRNKYCNTRLSAWALRNSMGLKIR